MARNGLKTLLQVRRRLVDQARRGVAACLEVEVQASQLIEALDNGVLRGHEARDEFTEWVQFLDMVSASQTQTRAERELRVSELANAEARTASARTVLAGARTRAEIIDQLIQERQLTEKNEAERRAQHTLDDIVRTPRAQSSGKASMGSE